VRTKWERHEYVVPVTEDLEFLNEARRHFHGDRFESLYQAWGAGTITERDLRLEFLANQARPPCIFRDVSGPGTPFTSGRDPSSR
jgi:hypothetical protein